MPRGGARKGAGGKKPRLPEGKKKIQIGTRLDAGLVQWLRDQDRPMAQLIEEAVRGWFKIDKNDTKPPNEPD